jgi:hypothetical protein
MPGGDLVQLNKDPETGGYRRYYAFTSSFPGGELSAAGDAVVVYHCLCGHPVKYGGPLPGAERELFQDSFQRAGNHWTSLEPVNLIKAVRSLFVYKEDFQAQVRQVQYLAETVKTLHTEEDRNRQQRKNPSQADDALAPDPASAPTEDD